MAYEPTEWKSGDVVTSAKLNKIEGGIASGGVLVATDTEGTLDKTWQEIHDSSLAILKLDSDNHGTNYSLYFSTGVEYESGEYYAYFVNPSVEGNLALIYKAESANGYPAIFLPG